MKMARNKVRIEFFIKRRFVMNIELKIVFKSSQNEKRCVCCKLSFDKAALTVILHGKFCQKESSVSAGD
jgi:hypothetical protein